MRVLLPGGTGFLGARAARTLLEAGHRVTVLSRGNQAAVPGTERLIADRRDAGSVAAALEGRRFDATVDFAAYSAADIEHLFLVPRAALGRFVMISSGQVYLVTCCPRVPCAEEDSEYPLVSEPPAGTPDHREWLYGVGKRRAEEVLLAHQRSHGVQAVILRPPIVMGEEDTSLRLWSYLERLLDGGPILLPDSGVRTVRFLYAGDLALAVRRLVEGSPPPARIYNLAQPDSLPLAQAVERIARAAGRHPRVVGASWRDLEGEGLARSFSPYAGPWSSLLDPGRAENDWGFTGTRLADYLPGVVRWHLEHRPSRSHPGYAQRPRELEIAARLIAAGG